MKNSYTADAASKLCDAIARGCSLIAACQEPGLTIKPGDVYRWLAAQEPNGSDGFKVSYEAALAEREKIRDETADRYVEEALTIADDNSADWMMSKSGLKVDSEAIARSKLRVDTRLKLAAKLAPKRYGDKPAAPTDSSLSITFTNFPQAAKPDAT